MNTRKKDDGDEVVAFTIIFLVTCCVLGVLYVSYQTVAVSGLVGIVALALLVKFYRIEIWDNYTLFEIGCFLPIVFSAYWIVDVEFPQSVVNSAKSIEQFEGMQFIIESAKLAWHTALNIKVIVLCHILALGVIVTACFANIIATNRESPPLTFGVVLCSLLSMALTNLSIIPTWLYNHFQV
ncbi:hypothetical protein CW749_02755 [Vibrio sp. vnigr-6D03]|uniref:hypothetical protein n=1 Tax=Vibrio sp. vnigr-6D03 TaxID=2058088 RepID=UPI000C3200FF|nr:hypothetical protein [Vibrio sp. vnigr-6D03]PKF81573.1 hypothetical protein CW749_02755 [Vibrio sp. vnigr-6D03]